MASLSLSACNKNSEPAPIPDVRTNLLLAHDWKMVANTITFNHDGKTEVMNGYDGTVDCARDNTTKFNKDKSLTYAEGAVACAPDLQPQTGTWTFNGDQTELTINSPQLHGAASVFQVLDLTEKTLQIRHTYTYRQDNQDYTGVEDYTYTAL